MQTVFFHVAIVFIRQFAKRHGLIWRETCERRSILNNEKHTVRKTKSLR